MSVATSQTRTNLEPFILENICDTGVEVGHGSFATVKQLEFRGLKCAGKKVHEILYKLANPMEKDDIVRKFAGECELLSRLHHPCIVQFLGIYFDPSTPIPILVMEYLDTTLSSCIDKHGVLPREISYSILRDVGLGLWYLHDHSPPIIHRDLSANNVLLDADMHAKISDLGVAKILNLTPAQMTQQATQTPGTPCYMPPEALVASPSYTAKIDNYSFGVLIIHILCGKWPFPSDLFRSDPQEPGVLHPVPEIDRRAKYLAEIGKDHPFAELIRQCISNAPASRPNASEVVHQIDAEIAKIPRIYKSKLDVLKRLQGQEESSEIAGLRRELESRNEEVESYKRRVETLTTQLEQSKRNSLAAEGLSKTASSASLSQAKSQIWTDAPHILHPQAKLKWKKCADLPAAMFQIHLVQIGEKVYAGGGSAEAEVDRHLVFQYEPRKDRWKRLSVCPVRRFALGGFRGNLFTIGGRTRDKRTIGNLYRYARESRDWKEYLKPMPTARYSLTVVTTKSAIIACAGVTHSGGYLNIVEVYTADTDQWHTADPLPFPCAIMTSVVIADSCFLLGGNDKLKAPSNAVLCGSISHLVEQSTSCITWLSLPSTTLKYTTAATLGGCLLAVGGCDDRCMQFTEVHLFISVANSWLRLTNSDLPVAVDMTSSLQLYDGSLMLCGGRGNSQNRKGSREVYIGTVVQE